MIAIVPNDPADDLRHPPHDAAAERGVLGAAMLSQSSPADLRAELQADDFFLPLHREVFEAIGAVAQRGRLADVVAVADELKARGLLGRVEGGEGGILAIANDASMPGALRHHIALVREKATLRRLIASCAEAMSRAYGGDRIEDVLPDVRRQIAALDVADRNAGPVLLADAIDPALKHIEDKAANPDAYQIHTGLADFDQVIGGMRAGQLVIVAAQPGQGKTSFAEGVAMYNGKRKVPVLVFSLEMLRQELIERALSGESGIDGRRIVSGTRLDYAAWKDGLIPAGEVLRKATVWIDERRTLTADQICSEARRWRQAHAGGTEGRALVVIDYLGLVRSAERTQNREREVAGMTRAFKQLAGELSCPVMLVSQLNRESAKVWRQPVLSDLRDSGAIEADADMVVFPWREQPSEEEVRNPPETLPALIIVAKHRNGPTGELAVRWRPSTTQFLDNDYDRWTGGKDGTGKHFTETEREE